MTGKKINPKKTVDEEILSKGRSIIEDFSAAEEISVLPKRRSNKLISIRLPMAMIKQLKEVANHKSTMGYQQIIKVYIAEGLLKGKDRETGPSEAVTYFTPPVSPTTGSLSDEFWQEDYAFNKLVEEKCLGVPVKEESWK